jgi:RHS repeat-associated protein
MEMITMKSCLLLKNYNTSGVLAGVNIKGFSFYSSSNYFGTASVEQLSTNNTSTSKFEFIRRGDVNGDGKDEVISKLKHSGSNTIYYIHYTNAVQQFSATVLNQYSDIFIKDVDGDKKEEIIVTIPFEFFNVYNQSGNLILTSDIIDFFDKNWVGDFNGDGNTEFFAHDFSNGLKIHYINKNEVVTKSYPNLFTEGINITQLNLKKELLLSNDFNNDGNADILHFYTPTNSNIPKYAIYFSNGVGFIRKEYIAPHNNNFIPLTTEDIDADGIAEIVDTIFNQTQPFYITKINPKSKRNLLTNIKNGHNLTAKIEYELLSEPNGIYTFTQSIVKNCKPIEAWAVKKITLPDGSGNLLNTKNMSYQYKNIFKHYYWGFLGFEQIKSCDNQTEMVTETNYNLTGENRVMPKMTQNYYKLSPNNILTKSVYRYNFNSLLYAPLNLSMNETLDSNFITNQHSSNQKFYDDNGNLTISSFTTSSYNMTRVFSSFINAGSHIPHLPQFMATSTTYKNEQNITAELRTYNNYGQLISSTNNLQTDLDIDTNDISVGYILYPTSGKEVTNTYTYHATYGWLSGTSTSIVGSTPRTASFEYFPNQRTLKKSFNALNQCTQEVLAYSKRYNTPIQIKDLQGNIANTILDTWGRPISTSITYPAGGSIPTSTQSTNTTYNWDIDIATNQLSRTEITHPYGNVSKVYTDNLGRTIKTITKNFNNDDVENKQEFDNFGRVKKEIGYDATDAVVEKNYTYKGIDEHYRLYTISTLFNTTTYETPTYNSNGEATQKVTEGSGAFKEQTTDAAGFLIKSEDNGGTIEYKYNSQGQLTETKVNGVVNNTMTYDAVNGTQTQLDAKSSIMNYKYNSWGELIEQTDNQATPNKYKLEYDILGRLKKRWLDAGEELTEYTYNTTGNGINQVQQITFNGQIDQSFTYDARHRLISQTQRILNNSNVYENYTTSYQYYDADNQLKQITYPENFIVAYQYKANGHLEHIRRDNPTSGAILYKTNSTNRNGQLKTYLSGNGATSTITYLANGMPRIFLAVKNGIILQNLEMDFDNYGNLLSRKDNISTIKQEENFTYNKALDQLKTITTKNNIPTPPISISKEINYATNGNVINKYDAGIPTPNMPSEVTYEYKNLHALEFLKEKCTTADNFIPYKVQHPTPQTIAYTAFNQPNVITENNFNTTFTYNTNYQRTKTVRKLGTTLQNTRYYLGNYEKDVTGTTTRHIYYIYGGNGLCALAVKTGTGAPVYYTAYTDHLGSLVTLTNNNSTPGFVARQSFDAWGRYRTPNNWNDYTVANNSAANSTSGNGILGTNGWLRRGYTMHEHYKEYGLINMNGRMYDPIVGRMLSPDTYVQDPTNSQNYNRYSYVLNNPLKYTDPTGWKYDYKSFYSTYENEETTGDDGGSNFGGGGGGLINPGFNVATWNLISGAWNTASNSGYNYSSFGFTNGVMTSASYNNVYYSNKKGEYGYWSNHNYSINYSTYIVSQWNKLNNEINSATTNNSPTTSTTQSGGWGDNYNIIDDINNATGAGLDAIGGLWSYAEKQSIKNINKEIAPLAKDATFLKSLKYVKTLGTASGIIGITIDGYNLVKQPTIGNALKFIWGIGVIGTGPIGGIADGLFEASGYKDKMFNGIDNLIINKK